jgi:hypothetical protein
MLARHLGGLKDRRGLTARVGQGKRLRAIQLSALRRCLRAPRVCGDLAVVAVSGDRSVYL